MSSKKDKDKDKLPKLNSNAPNKPIVVGVKLKKGLRTASTSSTATTSGTQAGTMMPNTSVQASPIPSPFAALAPPVQTNAPMAAHPTACQPSFPNTAANQPPKQPVNPPNRNKDNESTYDKTNPVATDTFSTSIYKKATSTSSADKQKKTRSIYVPGQDIGPAGQILSNKGFKVVERCGSGNYAKVYKVCSNDEKEYAVKIIDLTKTSKNYRVRFLPRELDILTRLQHSNIVQIYEIFQSTKMIFIFMEYTPNGTVADFLRQLHAIPEYVCKPMFTQIVDALAYMHSQMIAHRDLKLENILIDKYGQAKLTDFSYSLICQKDEQGNLILSRTFCGSLPYIPPEVLQEHEYDPRIADVWSLGVCLYVMLNDGLPFKFQEIATMLQSQLTKDWKFKTRVANQISEMAKDLVSRMLEPNVKTRITCSEILYHSWIWKK